MNKKGDMVMSFNAGKLVMTRGVAYRMDDDSFAKGVTKALGRYIMQDWGDTSENDKPLNDEAVKTKDRIMAAYNIGEEKIWIITDYGHEVTTILFPEKY